MAIGSWDPGSGQSENELLVGEGLLNRFINIVETGELERLETAMDEEERACGEMMRWPPAKWTERLKGFDQHQLVCLIKFFTCAEMKLPGWEAGDKSPVITINRLLKSRGEPIDRELLLWIRSNSTNRFIPNGALL